jgi:hypothetical protein
MGRLPFQAEILPDERSARFVRCVDQFDCLVLSFSPGDQSADFVIARCIEKYMKDILAIAEKNLRTSADNHRRTAGDCRLDSCFRDSGDAERIEQVQPVGGWQASLKPAAKKVLEDSHHNGIGSPFSLLDRLWGTLGQSRYFLC